MENTAPPVESAQPAAEVSEAEAITNYVKANPKVMRALEALVHALVTCDTPHCTQILHVTRRSLEYLTNHCQAAASAPMGGHALHLDSAAAATASCIREALGQGTIPEAGLCDAEVARAIIYTQTGRDYSYVNGRVDPLGDPHEDSMATSRATLRHSNSILCDTEKAVCQEHTEHRHITARSRSLAKAARQCAPDVVPAALAVGGTDTDSRGGSTATSGTATSPTNAASRGGSGTRTGAQHQCTQDEAAATWHSMFQHVCTPMSAAARPTFGDDE